jgi:hypothetical protein
MSSLRSPALLLCMFLSAAPSWADSLASKAISADATWFVYMNIEQFSHTQFYPLLRQEMSSLGIDKKLEEGVRIFGVRQVSDIHEILLYGVGQSPEKGVFLLRGTFDVDKLLAPIRANGQYQEIAYGDVKLHRWLHEEAAGGGPGGRMMYGAIPDSNLAILSGGLDRLKMAVDVLKGKSPCAGLDRFESAPPGGSPGFLLVAANGVNEAVAPQGQSAVLKQTIRLGLTVGEAQDQVRASLTLVAKNDPAASAIAQTAQGMVAYVTLAGADRPQLTALMQKVRVACDRSVVRLSLECSPKEAAQFLEEQRQKGEPRPTALP